jgi:hypothetical protein
MEASEHDEGCQMFSPFEFQMPEWARERLEYRLTEAHLAQMHTVLDSFGAVVLYVQQEYRASRRIYLRWSRGPQRDVERGNQSYNQVDDTHPAEGGLCALELTGEYEPTREEIAELFDFSYRRYGCSLPRRHDDRPWLLYGDYLRQCDRIGAVLAPNRIQPIAWVSMEAMIEGCNAVPRNELGTPCYAGRRFANRVMPEGYVPPE